MKTLLRSALELAVAEGAAWLWLLFHELDSDVPRYMLYVCLVYGLVVFSAWKLAQRRLFEPPPA